eukprot:2766306-Amphidinium_carterae.1
MSSTSAVLCGLGKRLGLVTWQRGRRRVCARSTLTVELHSDSSAAQRQQCSQSLIMPSAWAWSESPAPGRQKHVETRSCDYKSGRRE